MVELACFRNRCDRAPAAGKLETPDGQVVALSARPRS